MPNLVICLTTLRFALFEPRDPPTVWRSVGCDDDFLSSLTALISSVVFGKLKSPKTQVVYSISLVMLPKTLKKSRFIEISYHPGLYAEIMRNLFEFWLISTARISQSELDTILSLTECLHVDLSHLIYLF